MLDETAHYVCCMYQPRYPEITTLCGQPVEQDTVTRDWTPVTCVSCIEKSVRVEKLCDSTPMCARALGIKE